MTFKVVVDELFGHLKFRSAVLIVLITLLVGCSQPLLSPTSQPATLTAPAKPVITPDVQSAAYVSRAVGGAAGSR